MTPQPPLNLAQMISLPKSQDLQKGIDRSMDMKNHFRQGVDIVLVAGDYWGVVNSSTRIAQGYRKPGICELS